MRLRVVDFETTGEPPEADAVEAAFVDVVQSWEATGVAEQGCVEEMPVWHIEVPGWSTLVRPERKIDVEARAAHHLSDEDVAGGADWAGVRFELTRTSREDAAGYRNDRPDYLVAHNAEFEQQLMGDVDVPWICTLKAALRLWPDAPRHTNQVLRYWLPDCDPGDAGMPPHRALPDCRVTALILIRALNLAPIEQLVQWTQEPRYMPVIGFGKHRGKRWSEVPRDYITWVLRQDFDEDTKWNARQGLEGRS